MKKYLLLLILFIPVMVYADSAGPNIIGYDATVINPNGAKVYAEDDSRKVIDKNEVIPYSTKLKVCNEVTFIDEKIYVGIKVNSNDNETCWWGDKYILATDVMPLKEEFTLDDLKKENNQFISKINYKLIILNKNGIKLKKGPSNSYGDYNKTVPYNTKLTAIYGLVDGKFGDYWYYVNTNNYQGWINARDNYIAKSIGKILVVNNAPLVDNNGKQLTTIPSETIINEIYRFYENEGNVTNIKYYVEYNNYKGFINELIYGESYPNENLLIIKDTNVITYDGKVKTKLNKGSIVNFTYGEHVDGPPSPIVINNERYYYIEYNDIKGFIKSTANNQNNNTEQQLKEIYRFTGSTLTTKKDTAIHELPEDNNLLNKVIPANTTLSPSYKDSAGEWYYVTYDGVSGWVSPDDTTIIVNNNENQNNEEKNNTIIDDENNNTKDETKKDEKNTKKALSTKEIITYSIIGAAILFITGLVTFIVINGNKKDNSKENNTKVDEKENNEINKNETNEQKEDSKLENEENKNE